MHKNISMALISSSCCGGGILCRKPYYPYSTTKKFSSLSVSANPKKLSSSSSTTGRFDSKNKRSSSITKEGTEWTAEIGDNVAVEDYDDGFVMPQLPGENTDFWEGPQWDALGFFVQYMWAFGIIFALIACGIAVATYNEGATDFKETPIYKESVQSRELLEEPETSNSDIFESNPTEEAPSVK